METILFILGALCVSLAIVSLAKKKIPNWARIVAFVVGFVFLIAGFLVGFFNALQ